MTCLIALLGVALAGCVKDSTAVQAQAGGRGTGAVRDARALVGTWQSRYTEGDVYDVTHVVQLNGDGSFSGSRELTLRPGVPERPERPRRVTIRSASTWVLAQDGLFETFDLAGASYGRAVLRWVDANTIDATSVGDAVPRTTRWVRVR
jgi:hypothetical protein